MLNRIISNPYPHLEIKRFIIKNSRKTSYAKKAVMNVLPYSYYAYCLYYAADLASKLGISCISAIEFGVAGGNGLIALEKHAYNIEKELKVNIELFGFDTSEGLVPPSDYRDMPYFFKKGNYKMDKKALTNKLVRSKLVLGSISDTVPNFIGNYSPAPVGAIFFDLDYYSSTMDALALFNNQNSDNFLPRIFCYFDNILGNEIKLYNDFTGELRAIKEFNDINSRTKIASARHLLGKKIMYPWFHQIYITHLFSNDKYNKYISKHSSRSLSLR